MSSYGTVEDVYRSYLKVTAGMVEAAAMLTLAEVILGFHADIEEATVEAPPEAPKTVGVTVKVNGQELQVEAPVEPEKGPKLEALERKFRETFAK